jgi:hypothetical protein
MESTTPSLLARIEKRLMQEKELEVLNPYEVVSCPVCRCDYQEDNYLLAQTVHAFTSPFFH